MMGSFALRVRNVERKEGRAAAEKLVETHRRQKGAACYCNRPLTVAEQRRKADGWTVRDLCSPEGDHPFESDMTMCAQTGVDIYPIELFNGGARGNR